MVIHLIQLLHINRLVAIRTSIKAQNLSIEISKSLIEKNKLYPWIVTHQTIMLHKQKKRLSFKIVDNKIIPKRRANYGEL